MPLNPTNQPTNQPTKRTSFFFTNILRYRIMNMRWYYISQNTKEHVRNREKGIISSIEMRSDTGVAVEKKRLTSIPSFHSPLTQEGSELNWPSLLLNSELPNSPTLSLLSKPLAYILSPDYSIH